MKCPKCSFNESKVNDSRASDDFKTIRRRRECISCGFRFTTYEKIEVIPLMITKKNNLRQPYNRDKILVGMIKACEKRPVSREQIETAIDEIESSLASTMKEEIKSQEIGELVMEKLKQLDKVAYVRYASVYKNFSDLTEFKKAIGELQKKL
ncbi:MAG: transcriptional regulator NrdR [Bacillales bacterium]|jgi:transcriptional repressor NrdR|nr:transcriptional regulator NrdR [Bacillales bacterium]